MSTSVLMTADTVGGALTYALDLAGALAPLGVEVHLASMGPPASGEQRRMLAAGPLASYAERDFPLEWSPAPWAGVRRAGEWLLALEEELRPDVVHLNGYSHGALPWRAPCVVVAHSCVLSWWEAVHGTEAPAEWDGYRRRVRDGLALSDSVVAPSDFMLAALRRHYGCKRAVVFPHGHSAAWAYRATKEPFVLGAGRLCDEAKNLRVLGAAARRSPWPVLLAGDAGDAAPGAAGSGGAVLLGRLPTLELQEQLRRAAVFAHPASYEPFGLAVLEAAQAGCALVLGDIPSLRGIWGPAAAYVPPRDVDALAACLTELAGDPARLRELGSLARHRSRRYGAGAMGRRYAALYRRLAEGRRAA